MSSTAPIVEVNSNATDEIQQFVVLMGAGWSVAIVFSPGLVIHVHGRLPLPLQPMKMFLKSVRNFSPPPKR